VERAQSVDSNFALDDSNSADVAEICRRLDGLPLAIELAAARTRMLSPAALLPRLEKRLPLLTVGFRDAPARQQTLRDTLAWSYNLLAPDEQQLLRRLSVFVGGFTLEAAAAISGHHPGAAEDVPTATSVFDMISPLVDHSLIRQIEQGAEPRYGMLETIREFGLGLLKSHGELEATRRRHAEWISEYVKRIRPGIEGPDGLSVLDQYKREHHNIRGALTYAIESNDAELGNRLVAFVWKYWWVHGHSSEGRRWIGQVLKLPGDVTAANRLETLYAIGGFALNEEDFSVASRHGQEGLELARAVTDEHLEARMLLFLPASWRRQFRLPST
jgi:predicted ATPase